MQRALADADVLVEHIEHTGSAVFACPAGLGEGGYRDQSLFEA